MFHFFKLCLVSETCVEQFSTYLYRSNALKQVQLYPLIFSIQIFQVVLGHFVRSDIKSINVDTLYSRVKIKVK